MESQSVEYSIGVIVCVNDTQFSKHSSVGKRYNARPEEDIPLSEERFVCYKGNERDIVQQLCKKHAARVMKTHGIDLMSNSDLSLWGKVVESTGRHREIDIFDLEDYPNIDGTGLPMYVSHCYQTSGKIPRPHEANWEAYGAPTDSSRPIGKVIVSDTTTEPGVWWIYGKLDLSGIEPSEAERFRQSIRDKKWSGLSVAIDKCPDNRKPCRFIPENALVVLKSGKRIRFMEISIVLQNDIPGSKVVYIKAANKESLEHFITTMESVTAQSTPTSAEPMAVIPAHTEQASAVVSGESKAALPDKAVTLPPTSSPTPQQAGKDELLRGGRVAKPAAAADKPALTATTVQQRPKEKAPERMDVDEGKPTRMEDDEIPRSSSELHQTIRSMQKKIDAMFDSQQTAFKASEEQRRASDEQKKMHADTRDLSGKVDELIKKGYTESVKEALSSRHGSERQAYFDALMQFGPKPATAAAAAAGPVTPQLTQRAAEYKKTGQLERMWESAEMPRSDLKTKPGQYVDLDPSGKSQQALVSDPSGVSINPNFPDYDSPINKVIQTLAMDMPDKVAELNAIARALSASPSSRVVIQANQPH